MIKVFTKKKTKITHKEIFEKFLLKSCNEFQETSILKCSDMNLFKKVMNQNHTQKKNSQDGGNVLQKLGFTEIAVGVWLFGF